MVTPGTVFVRLNILNPNRVECEGDAATLLRDLPNDWLRTLPSYSFVLMQGGSNTFQFSHPAVVAWLDENMSGANADADTRPVISNDSMYLTFHDTVENHFWWAQAHPAWALDYILLEEQWEIVRRFSGREPPLLNVGDLLDALRRRVHLMRDFDSFYERRNIVSRRLETHTQELLSEYVDRFADIVTSTGSLHVQLPRTLLRDSLRLAETLLGGDAPNVEKVLAYRTVGMSPAEIWAWESGVLGPVPTLDSVRALRALLSQ